MLSQSAKSHCAYAFVSAGRQESTTDLIFSGHGLIAESGKALAENKACADTDYILYADIDIGKLCSERLFDGTFRDCAALYAKKGVFKTIRIGSYQSKSRAEYREIKRLPFIPSEKAEREKRCLEIFEMQAAALQKRLEITNCRPVVGVSGGLTPPSPCSSARKPFAEWAKIRPMFWE